MLRMHREGERELSQMVDAVLRTLLCLHAGDIVHADVRPANILMNNDGPFLIDFEAANKRGFEVR